MQLKRALILILLAIVVLGNSSCGKAPDLNWHPKIYVTDHQTESLIRSDDNGNVHIVKCSSPDFSNRVCVTGDEIVSLKEAYIELINKCERWKK